MKQILTILYHFTDLQCDKAAAGLFAAGTFVAWTLFLLIKPFLKAHRKAKKAYLYPVKHKA